MHFPLFIMPSDLAPILFYNITHIGSSDSMLRTVCLFCFQNISLFYFTGIYHLHKHGTPAMRNMNFKKRFFCFFQGLFDIVHRISPQNAAFPIIQVNLCRKFSVYFIGKISMIFPLIDYIIYKIIQNKIARMIDCILVIFNSDFFNVFSNFLDIPSVSQRVKYPQMFLTSWRNERID